MENVTENTILYKIDNKINEAKKVKLKLIKLNNVDDEIIKIDNRIGSLSLIKSELIKENKSNTYHMSEQDEIKFLSKMAKVREDNIKEYCKAHREDLVKAEQDELDILNEFLPKMPSKEELSSFISEKINEYLLTKDGDYKLSMRDMKDIKQIVTSVYCTIDGSLIKDVLVSKM